MNFEIINPSFLICINTNETTIEDKEHVTLFIKNNYPVKYIEINTKLNFKDVRLTIDYPSDYSLASHLISLINCEFNSNEINLKKISLIIQKYPWLKEINYSNFQKKQFKSNIEEIIPQLVT
jgi:spore coat polysaccharide biosynthesis protein SpsF